MKKAISLLLFITMYVTYVFMFTSCFEYSNSNDITDESENKSENKKEYTTINLTLNNYSDYIGYNVYHDNISVEKGEIDPSLGWQTYIKTYTIVVEFYPKSQNYKFENIKISTSLGTVNLDGYGYGRGQRYASETNVYKRVISTPSISIKSISGQVFVYEN